MNRLKIQWAKDYINYGIKHGIYEAEKFKGWSGKRLLKFAEREEARADWEAENQSALEAIQEDLDNNPE